MDTNAHKAPKTSSLEDYIRQIHYGDYCFERIFDHGLSHRPPQLRSDRINRILVHPGSFNPPHLGHLELLRHGFTYSGRDYNIVAAIVVFLDDKSLIKNFASKKNPVLFTKTERVRLWKGYVPSDWYWPYDRSESEWFDFQRNLTEVITKDGFKVSWVALCGPDYVRIDCLPSSLEWGCKEIIVSNIGRRADFVRRARNTLTNLRGCEAWEKLRPDLETIREYATEGASWLFTGLYTPKTFDQRLLNKKPNCIEQMVDALFEDAIEENNSVAVCHRRGFPESTIRFVPAKSKMADLSSTRVREIIQSNVSHEQLFKNLKNLVLSPEILLELLAKKAWEERVPSAISSIWI